MGVELVLDATSWTVWTQFYHQLIITTMLVYVWRGWHEVPGGKLKQYGKYSSIERYAIMQLVSRLFIRFNFPVDPLNKDGIGCAYRSGL